MNELPKLPYAREARFYRHSGRYSALGLGLGTLASIAAGAAMAVVYASIDASNPYVYLNLILCIIFGVVLSRIIISISNAFKSRNTTILTVMVVVSALISYYITWGAWANIILGNANNEQYPGIWSLIVNPGKLWDHIQYFNGIGVWKHSGNRSWPIDGGPLWVVWAGEFGIFMGSAIWTTLVYGGYPFCEECENWCKAYPLGLNIRCAPETSEEEFTRRMTACDFKLLLDSGWAMNTDSVYYSVMMEYCAKCKGTYALTIIRVTIVKKRKKTQEKMKSLLYRLMLTGEEARAAEDVFKKYYEKMGFQIPEF